MLAVSRDSAMGRARSVSPVGIALENDSIFEWEILFHEETEEDSMLGMDKEEIEQQLRQVLDHISFRRYPAALQNVSNNFQHHKRKLPVSFLRRLRAAELNKRINRLKRQRREAALLSRDPDLIAKIQEQLDGLEWSLKNRHRQIEIEVYLRHQESVAAVCLVDSDMDRGLVAVRTSPSRIYVVPVQAGYVVSLLSELAIKCGRFCCKFQKMRKYDRKETWENANFTKARFLGDDGWEAEDKFGFKVKVTKQWFDDLFSLSECDRVRVLSTHRLAEATGNGPSQFVQLDEGCGKKTEEVTKLPAHSKLKMMPLRHQNRPGEFFCMAASVGSYLAHKGHIAESDNLMLLVRERVSLLVKEASDSAFSGSCPPRMLCIVREALREHRIRLFLAPKKMKDVPTITESSLQNPLLLSLMGKRNGVNHAVVAADGLLYDSNEKTAKKLCLDSLEASCGGSGFGGIVWARVIHFASAWKRHPAALQFD